MAGNPFLKLVLQRIRDKGGWSPVLERVAAGESLTKIAATYECSRHTMYKLFHKRDELWDLFVEARRESAMALAEEATDIIDELSKPKTLVTADGTRVPQPVTREDIALARERVAQRRWLAQAYDRDTFGIQQPEGSSISIGALHLRVLQAPQSQPQLPSGTQPRVVEAEIIEEPANETH